MKISLYPNHIINPMIQQNQFYVSYFLSASFSIFAIFSPQKTVLLSHKHILSRMSEQLPVLLFNESAQMYHQGNFSVSLALLNDCILMHPQHSILYSNRALSNFARKDVEQAIQDLGHSIKLNHLNYVAYFNIFSIELQRGNRQEAFIQLCKCMSCVNTFLAKKDRGQLYVDEAIRFCFNNKQAIFMKAMENLQENRLADAHTMIKKAFSLEDKEQNKEGLRLLLNQLENSLDLPETLPQPVAAFTLKTDLKCPSQVDFEEVIKSMVGRFNSLNRLIGESVQSRESPSSEKSIQNSEKMEGQTNCMTFIESHLEQQNSMKKEEKVRNSCASTPENREDKLQLESTVSDHCEDQIEIESRLKSFDLYPLGQTKNVSLYIQQAKFYEDVDCQNIYATFKYLSEEKNVQIQTALSSLKDGLCRWSEWSQAIQLASSPSTVFFTLMQQKGTEDMIIGQGSFQLSQQGYLSVPFYMEEQQVGLFEMIVQRQQ